MNFLDLVKQQALADAHALMISNQEQDSESIDQLKEERGYATQVIGFGNRIHLGIEQKGEDEDGWLLKTNEPVRITSSGFDRDETCETTVEVDLYVWNAFGVQRLTEFIRFTYYVNLTNMNVRMANRPSR